MLRDLKCLVYQISKRLGLFAVARRITASRLRILCYHGLSIDDEHLYSPGLFMQTETVRSRFEILLKGRYPVLPLDQACKDLRAGKLPSCAVVITYDDGFYGNFVHGASLHAELALPATIYVTTYYVVKQTPIFRHAVRYMFYKTQAAEVNLDGLPGADGEVLELKDKKRTEEMQWRFIRYAETSLDEPQRVVLARELGKRLAIDYDELARSRRLSLMTPDEIRALARLGWDIQLHTHRHRFPSAQDEVRREIGDNRAVLEPIVGQPCQHLCYPSGVYAIEQFSWLEACGIISATTCDSGLNDRGTPIYGLRRFLDSEKVTPIEFEAEISGFAELLRLARSFLSPRDRSTTRRENYGH
jgi:peptidoglycan/xylan/chitin deacetylase (PgdA/CDA1 family)